MNNRQLAHEWANQKRTTGAGSHMFVDGPSIFSYGRHFEIARHTVGDRDGAPCVLFTVKSNSVTTARHLSLARGAVSHLRVFVVPNVGAAGIVEHGENVLDILRRVEDVARNILRARLYGEQLTRTAVGLVSEAAEYCKAFKVPAAVGRTAGAWAARAKAGVLSTPEMRAKWADAEKKDAAARKEQREKRAAAEAARNAEFAARLEAWARGEVDGTYGFGGELPTRLRIVGAAVETSRGAVVSVRGARVLWAAIKAGKDIAGAVIDGYTVSGFNGDLVIGCHVIARAEVERIGTLLDA